MGRCLSTGPSTQHSAPQLTAGNLRWVLFLKICLEKRPPGVMPRSRSTIDPNVPQNELMQPSMFPGVIACFIMAIVCASAARRSHCRAFSGSGSVPFPSRYSFASSLCASISPCFALSVARANAAV
jgi:hypothetical protein